MRSMVLSLLVENNSGVLSRVSGLFTRRGYNIDSISAGTTMDPDYTRITIVSSGEDEELEQIRKQVAKLVEVVDIKELPAETSVSRELVLVKVEADATRRSQVIAVADIFRAKIVDVAEHSLILELTGNASKLEAFINLLKDFRILDICRTGLTSMPRGAADEK
ncbi:MAG: acetolactate synthase small subunit [Lachnospiraceae bacterium]|nr:acetolactate synthase small subunit [Lachnospiraceae bacterium]